MLYNSYLKQLGLCKSKDFAEREAKLIESMDSEQYKLWFMGYRALQCISAYADIKGLEKIDDAIRALYQDIYTVIRDNKN